MVKINKGKLVTVKICKTDYDYLNWVAEHDKISIAHALSAHFSGCGIYEDMKVLGLLDKSD